MKSEKNAIFLRLLRHVISTVIQKYTTGIFGKGRYEGPVANSSSRSFGKKKKVDSPNATFTFKPSKLTGVDLT